MDNISGPTAAELRERRRQKILKNSAERMNMILSGVDGDEKRLAPAMEGGEAFSFVPSPPADATSNNINVASFPPRKTSPFHVLWRRNICTALCFGMLLKLLTLFIYDANVILPWAVFHFTLAFFTYKGDPSKINDESMQMLMSIVPPNRRQYAEHIPLLLSTIPRFMQDTVSMIAGFLSIHLPLLIISTIDNIV